MILARTSKTLRGAMDGNSFLARQHNLNHSTARFAKKWFNYENVASGRKIEPFLPTSLHCPNASFSSCASLRSHISLQQRGGAAAVACFEPAPHGSGIGRPRFFRGKKQIESVSAVRAVRQTGRWNPRKNGLGGIMPFKCIDLDGKRDLDKKVQSL